MRLLCCGDRDWIDRETIHEILSFQKDICEKSNPKENLVIIEGEAKGADSIAREEAEKLGLEVVKFPPQWGKYGKAAGPIRNTQMLDKGKPTHVFAFHADIANSKGTKNMINQSIKRGIFTLLFGKPPKVREITEEIK